MQPTEELTVTLTALEWNQLIAVISEGPYRVVAPLIAKIHAQAQRQNGQALTSEDVQHVPN